MKRRTARLPAVEHPPLHGLDGLAAAVERVPRLLLPERLARPGSVWTLVVTVVLLAFFMGGALLHELGLDKPPGLWAGATAIGAATAGALWWLQRARGRFVGWLIDFEGSRAVPLGQAISEPIALEGADHSLGCYVAGQQNTHVHFCLELRHARRGPLAELCTIPLSGGPQALAQQREQLDHCVDVLAQRLGIRRSGAPLR